MVKIIGVIAVFTACTAFGLLRSRHYSKRVKALGEIRAMLDKLSTMLRFRAMTVNEMLLELKADSSLSSLVFLADVDDNPHISFSDRFERAVDEWNSPLSADDERLLISIGNDLGGSDIDGQLSAIALHREQLMSLYDNACEESASKGKLCRSLGVLCGAFISILLV